MKKKTVCELLQFECFAFLHPFHWIYINELCNETGTTTPFASVGFLWLMMKFPFEKVILINAKTNTERTEHLYVAVLMARRKKLLHYNIF